MLPMPEDDEFFTLPVLPPPPGGPQPAGSQHGVLYIRHRDGPPREHEDIMLRRVPADTARRFRAAASTSSRLSIGSPIPMNTAWSTFVIRRKWSAWSRISDAVRFLPNAIAPVAQNVHVSGQPDCEERQSERRPSR